MPKTNTGLAVRKPKNEKEKSKMKVAEARREYRRLSQSKVRAWLAGKEFDMTKLNELRAIINPYNQ